MRCGAENVEKNPAAASPPIFFRVFVVCRPAAVIGDWGCYAHFRTNLNPQRWISVPHCSRRVAPGEQYYFLRDAAAYFKCVYKATICVVLAALVALACRKFWELTETLLPRTLLNVGRCSAMLNVGFVVSVPIRRHWKVFVLVLLLAVPNLAMDPSSTQTPNDAVDLATAAAAAGATIGASNAAGTKRARDNSSAASVPADGNASKFMSAFGEILRARRGGNVDVTSVRTSEITQSSGTAPSSVHHLMTHSAIHPSWRYF